MKLRNWTPERSWARLRLAMYDKRHPGSPWLPPRAVAALETLLKPTDRGIEWGSGRSTRWLAERTAHVTSVEHAAGWYERVASALRDGDIRNVDYRLCEYVPQLDETERAFRTSYVRVVEEFEPGSLSYALVDGVYRSACALSVLDRLRPGGLLIVDNIDWYLPSDSSSPEARSAGSGCANPFWARLQEHTRSWRHLWITSGVTDTGIWIKGD